MIPPKIKVIQDNVSYIAWLFLNGKPIINVLNFFIQNYNQLYAITKYVIIVLINLRGDYYN